MKLLEIDYDHPTIVLKIGLSNHVQEKVSGSMWNVIWDNIRRPVSRRIYQIGVLIEDANETTQERNPRH